MCVLRVCVCGLSKQFLLLLVVLLLLSPSDRFILLLLSPQRRRRQRRLVPDQEENCKAGSRFLTHLPVPAPHEVVRFLPARVHGAGHVEGRSAVDVDVGTANDLRDGTFEGRRFFSVPGTNFPPSFPFPPLSRQTAWRQLFSLACGRQLMGAKL